MNTCMVHDVEFPDGTACPACNPPEPFALQYCEAHQCAYPCPQCNKAKPDQMYPGAIFRRIQQERKFQDSKYGPIDGDGGHELGGWLIIAESELQEAKKALVHGGSKTGKGRDTVRAELLQLAAVCVAALEQWGIEE